MMDIFVCNSDYVILSVRMIDGTCTNKQPKTSVAVD